MNAAPEFEPVRLGVIGIGGIARYAHLPAIGRVAEATLAAVCDVVEDRARAAAALHGAAGVYTDYRALLDDPVVEAVIIATPNQHHAPPALRALESGRGVLVEKPMAPTAEQTRAMVDAARTHGQVLQCGLMHRFRPETVYLQEAIAAGRFGDLYRGEAVCLRRRGVPTAPSFLTQASAGGGVLMDVGVHLLDLTFFFLGQPRPRRVSAGMWRHFADQPDTGIFGPWEAHPTDVEDEGVALIHCEGGIVITLEASWASNIEKGEFNVRLRGTQGGAWWDPPRWFFQREGRAVDEWPHWLPGRDAFGEQLRAFCRSVRLHEPPVVPPEDSLRLAEVFDAMYQSAREGREIELPEQQEMRN